MVVTVTMAAGIYWAFTRNKNYSKHVNYLIDPHQSPPKESLLLLQTHIIRKLREVVEAEKWPPTIAGPNLQNL